MSEKKGRIYGGSSEQQSCLVCDGTLPWHFQDCRVVKGRFCVECKALWPRHYPGCSRDVLKISRWWIARSAQKELVDLYKATKAAYENEHGSLRDILPPEPSEQWPEQPSEPYVRDEIAQQLLQALRQLLDKNVSRQEHDALKDKLHDQIELLMWDVA